MSREIKFRAWDEPNEYRGYPEGCMTYNARPDCDADGIMQFTGLRDRDGKEIYEGDILDYGEWTGAFKGKGHCLHVVQWLPNSAAFGSYERRENITFPAVDPCGKVIGNIYENPELLETPK